MEKKKKKNDSACLQGKTRRQGGTTSWKCGCVLWRSILGDLKRSTGLSVRGERNDRSLTRLGGGRSAHGVSVCGCSMQSCPELYGE
jgi:hypothetical protein